eukprot:GHVH01004287.1.p1 GENE.GHVH01004287.1~~GHVH01004287.1.p1  ORF type:complete len:289 (+),score=15.56 GHVH01004287.1:52-918(+)
MPSSDREFASAMALSTILISAILHPFDVVRTRRQAILRQDRSLKIATCELAVDKNYTTPPYRDVIKIIYYESGVSGFFKGWLLVGFTVFVSNWLFVAQYQWFSRTFYQIPVLISNLLTGWILQPVVQPLWSTIGKIAACHSIPGLAEIDQCWPWESMYKIVKIQGVRALWAGLAWQMVLAVGHFQYTFYSWARNIGMEAIENEKFTFSWMLVIVASCAVTVIITMLVTTPIITFTTEKIISSDRDDIQALTCRQRCKWSFSGYTLNVAKSLMSKLLKYGLFELFLCIV